MTRIYF